MEIFRATRTAEQAGAYYVRIQAMTRKHQIPLEVEFDEPHPPDRLNPPAFRKGGGLHNNKRNTINS